MREDRKAAAIPNYVWGMDIVHEQLATCRKIRVLIIVDTFSRYIPVLDARFSYRCEVVAAPLDRACGQIDYPKTIRVDQGSDLISWDMDL